MTSNLLQDTPRTAIAIGGYVGDYVANVIDQWLLPAPDANPAMLEMFRDRDRLPPRNLLAWSGEFAGKYLTGACEVYRLTGDLGLREHLERFVGRLVELQANDGYLGPWPAAYRLTAAAPIDGTVQPTWDIWGHNHAIVGLLQWAELSGDERALTCAVRIGNLLCARFLATPGGMLTSCMFGNIEVNQAIVQGLALLYQATGHEPYLDFANQVIDEFAGVGVDGAAAGDYVNGPLAGLEFYETPRPRWESLHAIVGVARVSQITGSRRLRDAFEKVWWSIVKLDRHNNGGFSSGEQAQGNPYHQGAIETCCTVAWAAMSVDMLRLTGDSVVADELELSTLNSVVGMHSQSGRWVTYNTPMDGVRLASAHQIVFQSREGSPELNCCSVNGARGFGLIADWAVMAPESGFTLNWYGPATFNVKTSDGIVVSLRQETDYPKSGSIVIHVDPASEVPFDLAVRIPQWSKSTRIQANGDSVVNPVPGKYHTLSRVWKAGDKVQIDLDMSLHFWTGESECAGMSSIYRGPILLTYDRRFNSFDADDIPILDARSLVATVAQEPYWPNPFLLIDVSDESGNTMRLCDFGSAGECGSPYRSWLPIGNPIAPVDFSHFNTMRTGRRA